MPGLRQKSDWATPRGAYRLPCDNLKFAMWLGVNAIHVPKEPLRRKS